MQVEQNLQELIQSDELDLINDQSTSSTSAPEDSSSDSNDNTSLKNKDEENYNFFKKKYCVITQEIREQFIQRVLSKQTTIKQAAQEFGIKFSTSKAILQTFKKEGRIGKKKTRNRKKKQENSSPQSEDSKENVFESYQCLNKRQRPLNNNNYEDDFINKQIKQQPEIYNTIQQQSNNQMMNSAYLAIQLIQNLKQKQQNPELQQNNIYPTNQAQQFTNYTQFQQPNFNQFLNQQKQQLQQNQMTQYQQNSQIVFENQKYQNTNNNQSNSKLLLEYFLQQKNILKNNIINKQPINIMFQQNDIQTKELKSEKYEDINHLEYQKKIQPRIIQIVSPSQNFSHSQNSLFTQKFQMNQVVQ